MTQSAKKVVQKEKKAK